MLARSAAHEASCEREEEFVNQSTGSGRLVHEPSCVWTAREDGMPEKRTMERARKARRAGKKPTTQAGAFVREEMDHVRAGKHGARSTKQAIAIGLSKARRAGVKLGPPRKGRASATTRKKAGRDDERSKTSAKRSRGVVRALKREGRSAASRTSISRQSRSTARRRRAA
jgi:uncharacterized protein DUF6496